jgi:hypothetical protein
MWQDLMSSIFQVGMRIWTLHLRSARGVAQLCSAAKWPMILTRDSQWLPFLQFLSTDTTGLRVKEFTHDLTSFITSFVLLLKHIFSIHEFGVESDCLYAVLLKWNSFHLLQTKKEIYRKKKNLIKKRKKKIDV